MPARTFEVDPHAGLLETAEHIRRGELTSVEVTASLLDRIARHDGRLHSTVIVLERSARQEAERADAEIAAGRWRGPLHGIPIGIKDLVWTEGIPTAAGTELFSDFRPDEDATVLTRLREAGAVVIAKLAMTEAATFHHHPALERPVNPWSEEHWTGVSSSGSGVAVAAGFCFGAIGSDTGGSIRLPSAANNVTGIKPTWGRISRHGVMPLAESFDHLGPMARSARDAAAILQVIAGRDSKDPTALVDPVPDYLRDPNRTLDGLTLGIDWAFIADGIDREIVDALESTRTVLERLGVVIRDVEIPWGDGDAEAGLLAVNAEKALAHRAHYPEHADRYSPQLRRALDGANAMTASEVARGYLARERSRGRFRALFAEADLLLLPAIGRSLPTWDHVDAIRDGAIPFDTRLTRFTLPFNVTGSPTISLPAGFGPTGLPVGVQLAGTWLDEPTLIRAGAAFQDHTDFHRRYPDLDATPLAE
jgi:amidase